MLAGIIDSPCGNVFSIQKALDYLGFDNFLVTSSKDFSKINKLILPGVGNFGFLTNYLKEKEMFDSICNFINDGRHYLGICLGSQILCKHSEEDNMNAKGFSLINCNVINLRKRNSKILVPNMGWNNLIWNKKNIFDKEIKYNCFYFCHTYYMDSPIDNTLATLGQDKIPVVVKYLNAYGVQFHPEKSGKEGLKFIENFLDWKG